LDARPSVFAKAAELAAEAGFDAVDIKACHRYLFSELLASHTRGGRYGGSYENRTRILKDTVRAVRQAVGDRLEVTSRLNAHDAIEHPYGWGVDRQDKRKPDLAEPLRLVGELAELGYGGINISAGNPYFNPHVNRPAEKVLAGSAPPPEHPLAGTARIIGIARDILQDGRMDPAKVCITCCKCSQIMRDGGKSGCVVRDAAVYGPIYREGRKRAGG